MHGINKVQLIGNVGREPKTKYLESGVPVTTFSFATSETHRKKDGQRTTTTEWHNVVLWRGLAELAEKYVKKGDPLYIEGKLHTRTWTDRDGNIRRTTEIVANNLIMLSPRNRIDQLDDDGFNDDIDLDNFNDDDDFHQSDDVL
ncbi:MAG: single-stranded DNA-binding protein [Bacteroidales bacterium]|nr:single-stranded DNA-binding protein [Bacteroidales bacterium]